MLEIIMLFVCGKKVAEICKRKNRAAWPWVLMMIAFYIGGAMTGAIAAVIVTMADNPNAEEPDLIPLLIGYVAGAVLGMVTTFVIVYALPDAGRRQDEDDDYRPRRRSARRGWEDEDGEVRRREERPGRYGGRGGADEDDDLLDRRRFDERERY